MQQRLLDRLPASSLSTVSGDHVTLVRGRRGTTRCSMTLSSSSFSRPEPRRLASAALPRTCSRAEETWRCIASVAARGQRFSPRQGRRRS